MYLFLAFLTVPLIEIGLFIQIGGAIGLWPTLAIVVLTAVLGTSLVKSQGRLALGQMRNSFQTLSDPAEPLAHGAMILFAGALLLTPGFFTDAIGFALLMPPVRKAAFHYLSKRVSVAQFQMGPGTMHRQHYPGDTPGKDPRGDVIDGEYEDLGSSSQSTGPNGASGWVQGPK